MGALGKHSQTINTFINMDKDENTTKIVDGWNNSKEKDQSPSKVDGWCNDRTTQKILERLSKLEEEMKDLREQVKNTKSLP